MTLHFDHAVIAVNDLQRATGAYRSLGFEVIAGGQHDLWGTHNALVRFGPEYLELLAVHDVAKANQTAIGRVLIDFLSSREGGLVGYALATDDIEGEAKRLADSKIEFVGPFAMERILPSSQTLSWRLLVPVDIPWRRPWPFFIQWNDPEGPGPPRERSNTHLNRARSISSVAVVVRQLGSATELYRIALGFEPIAQYKDSNLVADCARFSVSGIGIDLLAPVGDGVVSRSLEESGEGLFEVRIQVDDIKHAVQILGSSAPRSASDAESSLLRVPPDLAAGARIAFSGGPA